jgi:type IV pilus assembly protein PilB
MLSTEPANGAFFADPAEPVAQAAQEAQPGPVAAEASAIPSATHESAAGPSAAMIDVPLGTLIFRAGLLDEKQLEDALREGMRTGRRLGEVLVERGWIQERELGRLLAGQKGLPFVEVSASDVEPAALEMLSEENAKLQVVLPLRHEGGQLVVAVADPSNELMLENLRRTLGASPKLVVASYAELVKAIGEAYASPRPEAASEPETVVAEPETPQPESQPPPQAEVERAPVVRPLPIVLRPKERAAEPPPVAEPIAPLTPPAVRPLPIILPRAEEPANEPEPAPLLLPPPAQPSAAAEEKAQVEEPEPVAQATETEPVIHEQPAPEPEAAAERAPTAPAEQEVLAAQPAPAPEFMLELPVDWPSAGEDPPEEPASPASPPEEPAPEPPAQEELASLTAVVLRLQDGTTLEVGTFPTVAEAAAEAQEVVIEIAAADRNSTWPFFAQRYLRPDLIISVDLVEASSDS